MAPNPGSDEAIDLGCRCPVIENGHGKGAAWRTGDAPTFWMTEDCPLHSEVPRD